MNILCVCLANIHEKYSDTKLLLIGVGESMDYIRNLVKALGVEADVIFLGLRHDVNRLMQAMDCFILPSRFEGLPVVGIEAQAADLPCFFSDSITREIAITKKKRRLYQRTSSRRLARTQPY